MSTLRDRAAARPNRQQREAAVVRALDHAKARGAIRAWTQGDSLGASLWTITPASATVPTLNRLTTHEAELVLAGLAAAFTTPAGVGA